MPLMSSSSLFPEEVGAFVDAPNAPFPLDNHLADGYGVALQEQVAAPAPRGLQPCGGGFVSHERSLQQIRSGGDPLECVSAREVRGRALHHAQRVAAVEQDNVGKRNGPMLFVDDSPRNRQALSQTELTAERGNHYGEDFHCFGRGVEGTKIMKKRSRSRRKAADGRTARHLTPAACRAARVSQSASAAGSQS